MHYKTIILELIQDRPELYEALRTSKRLLPALDTYAIDLKNSHEAWKARIAQTRGGSDPMQVASEAMELAIEEFQEHLPCDSPSDGEEPLSLDAAMRFIRRATPPA